MFEKIGCKFPVIPKKDFDGLRKELNEIETNIELNDCIDTQTTPPTQEIITQPDKTFNIKPKRFEPSTGSEDNPFHEDNVPYIGREAEFKLLESFVEDESLFKVWAISGSSGSGKTRLSRHWMQKSEIMNESWEQLVIGRTDLDTAFNTQSLNKGNLIEDWNVEKWKNFTPKFPTLFIIDYLYVYNNAFQALWQRFHNLKESNELKYKIRILLIDHVFPKNLDELKDEKRLNLSNLTDGQLRSMFYKQQPLELQETKDQDAIIYETLKHAAGDIDKHIIEEAVSHLKSMEDQKAWNPLFAIMLGHSLNDANKNNKSLNIKHLSRNKMINNFLRSKRRLIWQQNSLTEICASAFIACATIRRGVEFRLLKENDNGVDYNKVKELCKHVISMPKVEKTVRPFEPDILGECFFLKFVGEMYEDEGKLGSFQNNFFVMLTKGKKDAQIEDSFELIGFIRRLVRNLCNDNQKNYEVKKHWIALFRFFEMIGGNKNSDDKYLKWSASCALVEMLNILEEYIVLNDSNLELYNEYFTNTIGLINQNDIEEGTNDELISYSGEYILKYLNYLPQPQHSNIETAVELLKQSSKHSFNIKENWTPLMISSFYGNIQVVKYILNENEKDINFVDDSGHTALMLAGEKGYSEVVQYLLDKNASTKVTDKNNWTPLMVASQNGNLDIIKHLLDKNADIEARNINGDTSLIIACCNNHLDVTQFLTSKGANIEAKNKDGWTPLMWASRYGHLGVAQYLISKGADIEANDKISGTSLIIASDNGHLEVVQYLLDKNASTKVTDKNNWTPLMVASQNGNLDIIKHLLDKNADIEAASEDGGTSLIFACCNNHLDVTQFLTSKGANIEAKDKDGWTPLMWASRYGHLGVAQYLISKGADIEAKDKISGTSLIIASDNGHLEVVKYLVDMNANIEAASEDGGTSLIFAVQGGNFEIVKYLVEKTDDINATYEKGLTLLMVACSNGYLETVEYLISKGADIESRYSNGSTSLMRACSNGHLDVVKCLVDEGANIEAKNIDAFTPLIFAAQDNHKNIIEYLIDKNAKVDGENKGNISLTALMMACQNGYLDIVKYLIEKGASIEAITPELWTPLIFSCAYGYADVVKYLIDKGANIEAKDKDGWTPLIQASYEGYLDIVKYLSYEGANIQVKDKYDKDAYTHARAQGHVEIADFLYHKLQEIKDT
ncbi:MAG: ankyrin repeat domain-containing protein [Proteobacteria bacterium]|nr:ankyrin repeat domain-containing protein [Pseudomonadota bacterium]